MGEQSTLERTQKNAQNAPTNGLSPKCLGNWERGMPQGMFC